MAGTRVVSRCPRDGQAIEGEDNIGPANNLHARDDRSVKKFTEKFRLTRRSYRDKELPETARAVEILDAGRVSDAYIAKNRAEAAGGDLHRRGDRWAREDEAQTYGVIIEHGKGLGRAERKKQAGDIWID